MFCSSRSAAKVQTSEYDAHIEIMLLIHTYICLFRSGFIEKLHEKRMFNLSYTLNELGNRRLTSNIIIRLSNL